MLHQGQMCNPNITQITLKSCRIIPKIFEGYIMEKQNRVTKCFIAVHVGAGYHALSNTDQYKLACQNACEAGLQILDSGGHALNGTAVAIAALEDNPVTNAGKGSNLTEHGNVECDAGIMDGESLLFGAVGALSRVKNPICVARKMVEEQMKGELPLGRIPPSVLVGNGALKWAHDHGIDEISGSDLISQKALAAYRKNKQKLMENELNSPKPSKILKMSAEEALLDTVGVVCIDIMGNICSGVSSGGISLKHPGRVGHAAAFGSGCWAKNGHHNEPSVACCTTGSGEHLMRTLLAKECALSLCETDNTSLAISTVFRDQFLESPMLKQTKLKLGGALAVKYLDGEIELVWAHTTQSMCIGYMLSGQKAAKGHMSRLPGGSIAGISLSVEGKHFHVGVAGKD